MDEPILLTPYSTEEMKIYVRPDGTLCIAPVLTDDSGKEELDEL